MKTHAKKKTRFFNVCLIVIMVFLAVSDLNGQVNENQDVQIFYRIKRESSSADFITKLSDYYLLQKDNPLVIEKRLETATGLLKNDCDKLDFITASIYYLTFSNRIKSALKLSKQLEKNKDVYHCSKSQILTTYSAIAHTYLNLKRYRKARKYYFEVLGKARRYNDLEREKATLVNLGITHHEQKNLDSALYFYKAALNLERKGVMQYHVNLMTSLSDIYRSKKQYYQSLQCLLEIIPQANNDFEKAYLYWNLAETYRCLQDNDKMLIYYNLAFVHGKNSNNAFLQIDVCKVLSEYYQSRNNYRDAFLFQQRYDSISALMNLEKYGNTLDSLNYEERLKYSKLQRAKTLEKLSFESKEKKAIIIFLFFSVLFLLIVGYLLLQQRRKNTVLMRRHIESLHVHTNLSNANTIKGDMEKDQKNEEVKIPKELILKLEKLLMEKELYKDPNLSIQKLALKIGVGNDLLSKAINVHYGVPFRTLINNKRIELAMVLLLEEQSKRYSIEGIAKSVGYSNMATFYNNFKLIAGVTPTYFQSRGRKIKAEQLN